MGRNNLPPRIEITINMSMSDLYNLLSPLYPGHSDPNRLVRVSPAPSSVSTNPTSALRDVPSQRVIATLNTPDFPSLYDSHSIINVGDFVHENPLDLTRPPSPATPEETPQIHQIERPAPTASASSASTSTAPTSIPVDYPLFHRLVEAMETIATYAAHICSCKTVVPDSPSTAPPLLNPLVDMTVSETLKLFLVRGLSRNKHTRKPNAKSSS